MKEIVKNPATITHVLVSGEQVRQTGLHQIIDANRYSSLTKLLRITAYVLRFARRSKEKRGPELNAEEIRSAEELWSKSIQNELFPEKVCHMMSTRKTPAPILVRQFDLYIDESGIVRCKGRIQNSLLNQEAKTPMLLPSKHHVVDLIVGDSYQRMLHSGLNTTLTSVRGWF